MILFVAKDVHVDKSCFWLIQAELSSLTKHPFTPNTTLDTK